jgi:uncharacterized membrane protein (UPF0127 family)
MNAARGESADLALPAIEHGQQWLWRALGLLLVAQLVALLIVGANRPAKPHLLDPAVVAGTQGPAHPARVAGLAQVGFRVISAARGGSGRAGCALLADTPAQQTQGLMGRRDLAGYDAMVFRFPSDTSVPFYNKGVPIPLSLAWFDHAGVYVGQADLALCDTACPLADAGQPFRYAVEVGQGGLRHLGIAPGSALLVGGGCS